MFIRMVKKNKSEKVNHMEPRFLIVRLGVVLLVLLLAGSIETAGSAATDKVFFNEIMLSPSPGGYQWVELKNAGTTAVNLGGYRLTNEQGAWWYTIPVALPAVPSGALVVIVFDGAGSAQDDYNFSDNLATLHSPPGLVNILGKTRGQCALFTPSIAQSVYLPLILNNYQSWNPQLPGPLSPFPEPSIRAFVAWGVPPNWDLPLYDPAAAADQAGIWRPGWFVRLDGGSGFIEEGYPTHPDQTVGLLPGSQTARPGNWALYEAGQTTRGSDNRVPTTTFFDPPPGATMDGATFALGWGSAGNATSYRFQMNTRSDFSPPQVVDQELPEPAYRPSTAVAEGTYFWRVKVLTAGGEGDWSPAVQINIVSLTGTAGDVGPLAANTKNLNIAWKKKQKDTTMLCLEGCPLTDWDKSYGNNHSIIDHADNYDVQACISMIASYYGGKLSQDRISYEHFKNNGPGNDLGDDSTIFPGEISGLLAWALGLQPQDILDPDGAPSFAQIKQWVDAGQPAIVTDGYSYVVINGYFEEPQASPPKEYVLLLSPNGSILRNYSQGAPPLSQAIKYYWVLPGKGGAPHVRSDEPELGKDSDGDGINDFDELKRFNTNPYLPNGKDSDYDGVEDKAEIRGYVFENWGETRNRVQPDIDGDTFRNANDPDSDGGGTEDGCEDRTRNGIYEPELGETSNADRTDDKLLLITLLWDKLRADVDLHLIKPGGTMFLRPGDCYYQNKNPDWGPPNTENLKCGDPILDRDCVTDCTEEHITLESLEVGTYEVKVHYYKDHEVGEALVKVWFWLKGKPYICGPYALDNDMRIDVATIEWPLGKVIGFCDSPSATGEGIRPDK